MPAAKKSATKAPSKAETSRRLEAQEALREPVKRSEQVSPAQVERIAMVAHNAARSLAETQGIQPSEVWEGLPPEVKNSTMKAVIAALENPDLTAAESHDNWRRDREAMGWRYDEVLDRQQKLHPDLVPFDKLPPERQVGSQLFLNTVRAFGAGLKPTE